MDDDVIQELMIRIDAATKLATIAIELQIETARQLNLSVDLIGAAAELQSAEELPDLPDAKFEFETDSRGRVAKILTDLYLMGL